MGNPLMHTRLYCLLKLFVGICFLSSVVSSQCLEHQRSLLLQIKQELSITDSNSKLLSWTPTKNYCLWDGVTCDLQTGYVVGLDLSNSSISSGINGSSSIFSLHHLQYLDIAENSLFSYPFPSGFSRLSSLTHLNLSMSGFFGQVPTEISFLRMLTSLDLSCFSLGLKEPVTIQNPDIETFFENLTRLRVLYLDGADLSMVESRLWEVLSNTLPNLRVLGLSNCKLAGVLHPSLLQLEQLTDLQLSGNNFASRVPDFLAKFSSLKTLDISYCGLYGVFPNSLFLMRTLRSLDVSYNSNLTGTLPAEFPSGSRLEVIKLSGTMFAGNLPNSMVNLVFLQDLEISECSFSESIPPSFENLSELRYLDFGRNNFSGPLPSLALSKKITGLIFSHNHFSGSIPLSYVNGLNYLEVLYLTNNSLKGLIPPALFAKPVLRRLNLGQNQLNGQLKEFQNASSSPLREIRLSENELQGPIPVSIFKIRGLNVLELSYNRFNGTINSEMIKDAYELTTLDLSGNNFSFEVSGDNSTLFSHIGKLGLGSCNIKEFPGFLTNLMNLFHLDLSDNKIKGEIPKWIWKLGNEKLVHLNLSNNMLSGFEKPFTNLSSGYLSVLDLHSNFLQGPFVMPSPYVVHLDYSHNQFSSALPPRIFENLSYALFVSLSSNHLIGEIPLSVCEMLNLHVLDLSKNHFNCSIPECLGNSFNFLKVLNLRNNELHGILPKIFTENCTLRTLDVNQNHLEGPLPRSLANCGDLEVLDAGNNFLNDSFPFWLETLPLLRVLILRSNFFGGSIIYSPSKTSFPMLQIIDLSSNKFRGNLSSEWFKSWKGMMKQQKKSESSQVLRYSYLVLVPFYYQDSVTLVNKGLYMELVKILTIFTSIDLSNNLFEGEIPQNIGDLDSLYVLNLSNNHLTGQIPSSFGKLKELGSLDLSENRLSGKIPQQLTALTFLSVLKLSRNLLAGEIPQGNQFGTFTSASFEGNIGLCGPPLTKTCSHALPPIEPNTDHGISNWGIDWNFYWIGFGFGGGMGLSIGFMTGAVGINIFMKRRGRRRRIYR